MHDQPDISDAEIHECFGVSPMLYSGPRCDDCQEPMSEHGTCADCMELRRELEQDDVWPVWLASLKTAWSAGDMDALDDKLAGWKYDGADIRHEKTAKGVSIAEANNLRFIAPGHKGRIIFTRQDDGMPVVTVAAGADMKFPDWLAIFTTGTPHEIILAACNAVIHKN